MSVTKSKITLSQLNRVSEITGNIAVAWFAAGTIAPIFTKPPLLKDLIINVLLSVALSGLFVYISLELIKKRR